MGEADTQTIIVSKNGALRDPVTGQFVPGGKVTTAIASPSQAREMVERKMELKRERARLGANRALEALRKREYNKETKKYEDVGPMWEDPSDLDFVEAITEAQAAQALLVGDPSSTKAAEFVLRHTGYDEPKGVSSGDVVGAVQEGLLRFIAEFAASIPAEVVDALEVE